MSGAGVVSGPVLVKPPTGYRWTSPPISIYRENGKLFTTFLITSLIPAITKTYYVNPVTGSDAAAGTSGAPLQKLSTALAKSDVDQIILQLSADYIALGSFGWNNTQPTRSVSIINSTGFRFISVQAATTPPVWTVNGTFANVYQTPLTAANSGAVTDLNTSSVPTYTSYTGATVSLSNVPQRFVTLNKVASIAAVNATAGTWFNDATNTYVRAFDDRNLVGGTKMYGTGSANNGRFPSVNNTTIYVDGIDFVGGRPFYVNMASSVTGCIAAFKNCSFQGGSVTQSGGFNGLSVQSFSNVYSYRCACFDNGLDGFNYHSFESNGTTSGTSPSVIEIESVAAGNGETGSGGFSDNASTSHDFCNLLRLNCVYIDTADRTMIDVDNSNSWNLGCHVGQSTIGTASGESIFVGGGVAGSATKMWIDSCYAPTGAFPRWASVVPSGGSAALNYFNSGAVVNSGANTGTVATYVA